MNPKFSCPVGEAHGFPVGSDAVVHPFVARLLGGSAPFAVFRAVMAVYVNSLKGKPCWRRTHVSVETGKVVPPGAYEYPSAAVVGKLRVRLGKAAPAHVSPGIVLPGPGHSMLFSTATTATTLSVLEGSGCNQLGFPAIAKAVPSGASARVTGAARNYQQFFESLAGKVVGFSGHFITSIMANNHWRERSNRVIEVPLSAAKPSYAGGF